MKVFHKNNKILHHKEVFFQPHKINIFHTTQIIAILNYKKINIYKTIVFIVIWITNIKMKQVLLYKIVATLYHKVVYKCLNPKKKMKQKLRT